MRLIWPVTLLAVATHGTGTRCVARVNVDHAHARLCGFVANKRPQLPESPGVARTTLRASNRTSFPNPFQVFERECLTLRACLRNQRLADAVVRVFLKAVFSSRIPFQPPASAASVCQLRAAALVVSPLPNRLNLLPAVVVNHSDYVGYNRSSLSRASGAVKRQSLVALAALRRRSQAATSVRTIGISGSRRSKH